MTVAHSFTPIPAAVRQPLGLQRSWHAALLACWLVLVPGLQRASLAGGQQPGQPASSQGKIVAIQGRVDHTEAKQESWDPATLFQSLFVDERVRTLVASRTAILFIDETQVKLNAGAVLTVRAVRTRAGGSTTFDLLQGEGWFRTKNPAGGVTVQTPAASATLRGTEINVEIRGQETVLTVTEGAAEFANPFGSLLVNAGEEATALPGQAPTKRVILNPEDAVQWALYYPAAPAWRDLPAAATSGPAAAGFDRLRAGDATGALAAFQPALPTSPWSRIGASMAYVELGDIVRAREVLNAAPVEQADRDIQIARATQLAAAALAAGDARTARQELDAALRLDPDAVRSLTLLSSLELTQNRIDRARELAAAAIAADANSVAAYVAAGEAAQAIFDLREARRHFDRAVEVDATDLRALVDRARVRFGVGDTAGAETDARAAAALAPGDAQVRSLAGFIKLAQGDEEGARADFDAAIGADANFGEPHLGLGLLQFRRNQPEDGLLEMLTATLLEPKVSLYQSYLGKAYYQLKRFPEGLSALETAKRLDPRDPTPWLYSSLFLRDQYQQLEALQQLRQAIARNDNRAVYRSRLLLDRDLATKNVSLAQIYRELGFEAWGAFEAQNSLDADFTNASAHLFLADTYGRLPDRTQALGSEQLQYFLNAPVNRNSFNNFNEFTALLEQPGRQASPTVGWGSDGRGEGRFDTRSGNERVAHAAFIEFHRENGVRLTGNDETHLGFAQGKLAFGPNSDLFVEYLGARATKGEGPSARLTVGRDTGAPVSLQLIVPRARTITNRSVLDEVVVGFRHTWRPASSFTAVTQLRRTEQVREDLQARSVDCLGEDLIENLFSASRDELGFKSINGQAQQTTRVGRHQIIVGAEIFRQRKTIACAHQFYLLFGSQRLDLPEYSIDVRTDDHDRTAGVYVRDEIELTSNVHVTVGARYDDVTYGDRIGVASLTFSTQRWNPLAGGSVRLGRSTMLRAAAFRNVNSDFLGAKIAPPTVSGFVVARNEFPTAERGERGVSLEHGWSRGFVGVRGFARHTEVPAYLLVRNFFPEFDNRGAGVTAYVNLILNRRLGLFADQGFVRTRAASFQQRDNRFRVGLNFVHPRGLFAQVATAYTTQRFSETHVPDLPRSGYALTDLNISYEFAGKRGLFSIVVTNLFDRGFLGVVEGLSVETPWPERRTLARLRWRF